MPTYTPPNSIFDGPITNLLPILCMLIEILSRAHAKGTKKKSFKGFKFATFIGPFPCDGAASMDSERVNQQTDIELTNDGIKTVAFFLKQQTDNALTTDGIKAVAFFLKQQTDNALANKHIIMVTRFCSNPPKKPKKTNQKTTRQTMH